jgi:dTDP-4-dehydrorhamnose reductase
MTPRVLVLGAGGMLGHKLFQGLQMKYPETYGTLRVSSRRPPFDTIPMFQADRVISDVDVMDLERLRSLLRSIRPDVVVNCIGVIKQREAANAAIPCIHVNALLPHALANVCSEWGGRLIHFSTDCVFSGLRGGYRESDVSDADDLYGRTKHLGEVIADNAITLRTSIIGRELTAHRSLLDWFLFQPGGIVKGFRRVIYSGITTNEMVKVVSTLIAEQPQLSGLFQVVANPINKFELLTLVRDAYGLSTMIQPDDIDVSDRSMCGDKFFEATGWRAPSWPELVRDLAADPTPYAAWAAREGSVTEEQGKCLTAKHF